MPLTIRIAVAVNTEGEVYAIYYGAGDDVHLADVIRNVKNDDPLNTYFVTATVDVPTKFPEPIEVQGTVTPGAP